MTPPLLPSPSTEEFLRALLSPVLFNYYLHDIPQPPPPTKLTSYADDLQAYSTNSSVPAASTALNNYLPALEQFLDDHDLQISVSKSSVSLFTPDSNQSHLHPQVHLRGTLLPLDRRPKILGVRLDTFLSFKYHAEETAGKVIKSNNALKALAGTSWGQDKETLTMTYKAIGRSVLNYASPTWSPFLSNTSYTKLQRAQNTALRSITGCCLKSAIHHLHQETGILPVREHSELLSIQFTIQAHLPAHPCFHFIHRPPPRRRMKPDLFTTHAAQARDVLHTAGGCVKSALKDIHTSVVRTFIASHNNAVLGRPPPPIDPSETTLPRKSRTLLSQLRSNYCPRLNSYQHILHPDIPDLCPGCGRGPHNVHHLFTCPAHRISSHPVHLWSQPTTAATDLNYLLG